MILPEMKKNQVIKHCKRARRREETTLKRSRELHRHLYLPSIPNTVRPEISENIFAKIEKYGEKERRKRRESDILSSDIKLKMETKILSLLIGEDGCMNSDSGYIYI